MLKIKLINAKRDPKGEIESDIVIIHRKIKKNSKSIKLKKSKT